jgi:thioredoxin 1
MKEILHFTASWCSPCQKIKPIIEEFIDKHPEVMYTKIDVDESLDKVNHYEVRSVPTLVILEDGFIFDKHSGVLTLEQLNNLVSGNQ